MNISEDMLEQQCLEWPQGLGWDRENGADIAPGSENAKRESYAEVLIIEKLEEALVKINPRRLFQRIGFSFCFYYFYLSRPGANNPTKY